MGCTGECSGCSDVGNCEWFFNNFILPDIIEEQQKEEYFKELREESHLNQYEREDLDR